jgi:hypothetical protein
MSIKIYNGYIIKKKSLKDLMTFCNSVQKVLEKEKNLQLAKYLIKKRLYGIDRQIIRPDYQVLSFQEIQQRLRTAREENRKGLKNFEIELDSSAVFIPSGKNILVYFCCDNETFIKKWQAIEEVSDYHYQNSIYCPNHIEQKDWNKRKKDWEKALSPDWTPAKHGMTFVFTDFNFYNLNDIATNLFNEAMPSEEERIKDIANDESYTFYLSTLEDKDGSTFSQWLDWAKSDNGREKINEIKNKLKNNLKTFTNMEELFKC